MLLNFKSRFVPMILDGSKQHTIRAPRKIAPKVGEICHCYTGLRQKGARLLGRWPCVKVEEIIITRYELVLIDDQPLSLDECDALAKRDGFPGGFTEMMEFWQGRIPFRGHIIHWRWSK